MQGGEKQCPHCFGTYVLEQEVRCLGCDGPMCPICVRVVLESQEMWCPDCHGDKDAQEKSRGAENETDPQGEKG